jgi:hypothetical protein
MDARDRNLESGKQQAGETFLMPRFLIAGLRNTAGTYNRPLCRGRTRTACSAVMFSQRSPGNARAVFSALWRSIKVCIQYSVHHARNAMRNTLFVPLFATLSLILTANLASAEQFGTADEARAMLDRAIAALKSDEVTALRAFSDTKNKQFHDRDLTFHASMRPTANSQRFQVLA